MEISDLDVEDVRKMFEDWYTGNIAKSERFPSQYRYDETQAAWEAFLAGYDHCHTAAISAIKFYFETKWRK